MQQLRPKPLNPLSVSTAETPPKKRAGRRSPRLTRLSVLLLLLAATLLIGGWVAWRRSEKSAFSPPVLPTLRALQADCERRPDQADAFVALGTRLEQLGADRLAYGAFARAASLSPDSAEARIGWAQMAATLQSPRSAVAILAPFVETHPAEAGAHLLLAQWYQQLRLRRRAYAEAAAAARLEAAAPAAPRQMATAAMALERYPDAEAALRRVLALSPSDWHSALDLGFVLDRQGRPVEAVECYRQAARTAPGEAEPLRMCAQAILQQSDTWQSSQEAGQYLAQAVQRDPNNVLTHVLLAQVASRRGDWREARTQLDRANGLPPASSEVQALQTYLDAQAYRHFGQTKPMQVALRRHAALLAYQTRKSLLFDAIVAHPSDPTPRLAFARACATHGDFAEALSAYARLLSYAPDNPARQEADALLRQHPPEVLPQKASVSVPPLPLSQIVQDAATLAAERQYDAARQGYQAALTIDQHSGEALLGLGVCLQKQGQPDMAFAFLDQAFENGAQDAPRALEIARQFEANGFHEGARVRLERLVAADPGNALAWHLLGSVCSQGIQHSREGRDAYRRAAALAPQNVGFLLDAADADAEDGQLSRAEAEYRGAVRVAPASADALSRLGGFLVSQQADRSAVEAEGFLTKALTIQPDNEFAWYQRGVLALEQNRPQTAITELRRSAALAPSVSQTWYSLARAYRRNGNAEKATQALLQSQRLQQNYFERSHLEESLHLAPGNLPLRLRLARVYAAQGENARALMEYQAYLRRNPSQATVRRELIELQKHLSASKSLPSLLIFRYMLAQQQT